MRPCLNILEIEKGLGVSPNAKVFGSELRALVFVPVHVYFILVVDLFFNLRLYFLEFKGV